MTQYVYFFGGGKADGNKDMKDLLGGKGSGLAEMTNAGLPVPPGFTVSTAVCNLFVERGGSLPEAIHQEIAKALERLEGLMGKKLGAAEDPLLVSVRSGAKFSMPGMMDTILNLGLNDRSVEGLKAKTRNGRFAKDSYRRFIQMFGNVVLGIDKDAFEHELGAVKKKNRVVADVDLDEKAFDEVIARYRVVVQKHTGHPFPQDPREQLAGARDAVFRSWMNPRAATYRRLNDIPHDLGTAVNVQAMVFGNMGDTSATGVGFTRNPSTGAREFYGEFLQNAQGEDVVAGTRTPHPIAELEKVMPVAFKQLREITTRLERHYKDVQDFEFTIQENKLYMLQTRNGKRTGLAAVHIAVDLVEEGILTPREAVMKVEPPALDQLLLRHDCRTWAYVTAHNPASTLLHPEKNQRRQRDLEEELSKAGRPFYRGEGVGTEGDWPAEQSVLILGISRQDALDLAESHGQAALVFGEIGQAALLLWTGISRPQDTP